MEHSLTPSHPRRPHRQHLSVIGQLSLCARALILAGEWHFVPQRVLAVCHAGLCISVRCHAVPKPWQGTNIIHTPVRLTEPWQTWFSLSSPLSPSPASGCGTAELFKEISAVWSSLTVMLKIWADVYSRDLSVCGTLPVGGFIHLYDGLMHWFDLPYHGGFD